MKTPVQMSRAVSRQSLTLAALGALAIGLVSVACGDEAEATPPPETGIPTQQPTEQPTGTPSEQPAEDPQPQSFDDFVSELEDALARGDIDFIADRLADGGIIHGGWRSEGSDVTAERARELVEWFVSNDHADRSDEFGSGKVSVYAINDGEKKAVILTGIVDLPPWYASGTARSSMALFFEPVDSDYEIDLVVTAYVFGEEFLTPDSEAKGLFPDWERLA